MLSIKKEKRSWSKCVVNLVYSPVEKKEKLVECLFDLHYGKQDQFLILLQEQ